MGPDAGPKYTPSTLGACVDTDRDWQPNKALTKQFSRRAAGGTEHSNTRVSFFSMKG